MSFYNYLIIIVIMNLFLEGQKITLYFQKASNMVEMTCSIDKVMDDRLDLILPQYFMRYVEFLNVGNKVTAKAFSKFGTIDFNTIIISSPLEDTFTIELDYNSVKLTADTEMPLVKTIEPLEVTTDEGLHKFKTFEISTENIRFYSDKKMNVDDVINCALILPKDYGIINFTAVITDIDQIYDNEYTAKYITTTEVDRQTLLFYMYMYNKDTD